MSCHVQMPYVKTSQKKNRINMKQFVSFCWKRFIVNVMTVDSEMFGIATKKSALPNADSSIKYLYVFTCPQKYSISISVLAAVLGMRMRLSD